MLKILSVSSLGNILHLTDKTFKKLNVGDALKYYSEAKAFMEKSTCTLKILSPG